MLIFLTLLINLHRCKSHRGTGGGHMRYIYALQCFRLNWIDIHVMLLVLSDIMSFSWRQRGPKMSCAPENASVSSPHSSSS